MSPNQFDRALAVLTSFLMIVLLTIPGCNAASPTPSPPGHHSSDNSASASHLGQQESLGKSLPPQSDEWFVNVTKESGIRFAYRNGQEAGHAFILESLGGGTCLFDFDGDDDLDIFVTGGGTIDGVPPQVAGLPSVLFRNDDPFRFTNITAQSGVGVPGDYSHGCFTADYDSDGFTDVLVTAYGGCRLFHNCGDGSFQDISSSISLNRSGWWTGAAWGDVDLDGYPDLFVTGYVEWTPETHQPCWNLKREPEVCSPRRYPAANDCFFRNKGDGTFEDASDQVGLIAGGNGLGVIAAELNGDDLIDFYVGNDETDNFLYLGRPQGTLVESAHQSGVAVNQYGIHEGSMGVEAGDYDGDGRPDLWVTNFESEDNALYRNLGGSLFVYSTNVAGLAGVSRLQVGFGTALEDFDGDGWLDLLVVNGHVFYAGGQLPYRQKSQLFRNNKKGRFEDVSAVGGSFFQVEHSGRGLAVGDLDHDGGLDAVVVQQNEPVQILRNRKPMKNFFRLKLVGTQSDRDGTGAVVTVLSKGDERVRLVRSGAGYFSQSDHRILLPADAGAMDIEVRWLGGIREVFRAIPPGQTYHAIQGQGESHANP